MASTNETTASALEAVAAELDEAAAHSRTASRHYRAGEVPRGAAHAWAAFGHLQAAQDALEEQARIHAQRSRVVGRQLGELAVTGSHRLGQAGPDVPGRFLPWFPPRAQKPPG